MDCVYGTGIHASAAVDAGIGVDDALVALLADGVDRTGILTCCAVGAIVGNSVSHGFSSFKNWSSSWEALRIYHRLFLNVQQRIQDPFTDILTKYVEFTKVLMYISKTVLFQLFILV
jgi:hypothetical protein